MTMRCFRKTGQTTSTKGMWIFTRKRSSKLYRFFNLTATFVFYTRKTFTDSEDHEIIEEGYKVNMSKDMGVCPCDFPTKKICIYFSWRKEFDLETNSRLFQPNPCSRTYQDYVTKDDPVTNCMVGTIKRLF